MPPRLASCPVDVAIILCGMSIADVFAGQQPSPQFIMGDVADVAAGTASIFGGFWAS